MPADRSRDGRDRRDHYQLAPHYRRELPTKGRPLPRPSRQPGHALQPLSMQTAHSRQPPALVVVPQRP